MPPQRPTLAALVGACSSPERPPPRPEPKSPPPAAQPAVAAPAPPKRLFARKYVSRLRQGPSLESPQLGYMRPGTVMTAKSAEPVGHERCRRGWYEIEETGGFVCDGREVTAFTGDTLPDRAPTPADRAAPLPYRYAYNRRAGTPMYKRLPSEEEALRWEDGVMPDAGAPVAADAGSTDAGVAEPSGPATLADLAGERGALVRRTLNTGFFVSLDRDFETAKRRYWRTLSNGYIPYASMVEVPGSDFEGVRLGDEVSLPIAYVLRKDAPAYRENARGKLTAAGTLARQERLTPAGVKRVGTRDYLALSDGRLVRAEHVNYIEPAIRPKGVPSDALWIDVNLASQSLVAYEGDDPVFATLVSTGRVRRPNNPLFNHATPTGRFRILSKHVTATMDGDHAVFGAYSLEDVPYVQFFQGAYALHGAFWHNKFGRPASHGCINIAPKDAHWLFGWTAPRVPEAWHGAYPAEGAEGTWLVIHGTTPRG